MTTTQDTTGGAEAADAAVNGAEAADAAVNGGEAADAAVDGGAARVAGYSGKRAAEIVGISYRQLDYWARTDLIRPSVADAAGSGSRRAYSYRDLLELKVVKSLLDSGIKLELVRRVFAYLRDQLGEDVTTANLVINGNRSVLVHDGEELIDVLQHGQGVLSVLPLAGVVDEIDARIVELVPNGERIGPAVGSGNPAADAV